MTTEENKRMLALSCIVADMKAENMELEQRVHQLVDEYNEVVRQLNGNKKRNGKDSSNPTLDEMQHLCAHSTPAATTSANSTSRRTSWWTIRHSRYCLKY